MPVAPAGPLKFHLIDDALLVLDKPSGLLCVPGRGEDKQDCLSARVQAQYPDALIVHRLDMATSGLLLMARGLAAQQMLSRAFAERRVHKQYTAVVRGLVPHPPVAPDANDGWGLIDLPIAADWPRRPLRIIDTARGKPSQTRWRIESHNTAASTSRLLLEPLTGRTHQLRVHLQAIGHPIVGDALYGVDEPPAQPGRLRLHLHASALAFAHPVTGAPLKFTSNATY
jgi:tRNA pseudouridine32 synthase/23S rRNA pseudouridine746 synthase